MNSPERYKVFNSDVLEFAKQNGIERASPFIEGYNFACDEWKNFLPDVDELCEIIEANLLKLPYFHANLDLNDVRTIAKSIAKRIGKEADMRMKGKCGGKRRFDGSGKGKGNYGTRRQPKKKKR